MIKKLIGDPRDNKYLPVSILSIIETILGKPELFAVILTEEKNGCGFSPSLSL
ncbi:MAG: hypothetical protein ACK5KP_03415 [Paludibacteraceae bacterium]